MQKKSQITKYVSEMLEISCLLKNSLCSICREIRQENLKAFKSGDEEGEFSKQMLFWKENENCILLAQISYILAINKKFWKDTFFLMLRGWKRHEPK